MSNGRTFRDPFEPMRKTMSLALPMILADRRLKQQEAQADRNFLLRKQQLMQKVEESKDKIAMELYLQGIKTGDREAVQAAGPLLEGTYDLPMTEGQPAGPASDPLPGEAIEPDYFVPERPEKPLALPKGPMEVLTQLAGEDVPRLEELLKMKRAGAGKVGETPEQKELKRLEDDIMQIGSKMESIESGQDIVSEAIGSKRGKVATDLQKRLLKTLKLYKKNGGNPERLGFDLKAIERQIQQRKSSEIMKLLPSPEKHKGEIATDTETGYRYKSDGKKWVEIK